MASQDFGRTQTLIEIPPSHNGCMPALYILLEPIKKKKKSGLTPSETMSLTVSLGNKS